jgi:hypothetical protein
MLKPPKEWPTSMSRNPPTLRVDQATKAFRIRVKGYHLIGETGKGEQANFAAQKRITLST